MVWVRARCSQCSMAETVSRKRPSLTSLCSAGAMDDNAQKLSGTSDLINVFDTLWCTTPLMKAMLDQDMNAFESLLNDDSVDVNEDIGGDNKCGWTILHAAVYFGLADHVTRLLQNGRVSAMMQNQPGGRTALHMACGLGHVEILRRFQEYHPITSSSSTSLHTSNVFENRNKDGESVGSVEDFVDVYVSADGYSWSCSDSQLYKIPTEVFDRAMAVGSLETQDDLDRLMENIVHCNPKYQNLEGLDVTDVYVQNGFWSGEAPYHFKVPSDVFTYLARDDDVAARTIGVLTNDEDLSSLIENTRDEIKNGPKIKTKVQLERSLPLNVEMKNCGHVCTMSSLKDGCCSCLDTRPHTEDEKYLIFVDGIGWQSTGSRGCHYCAYCMY